MSRKTFIVMLSIITVTFSFNTMIKYYRPQDPVNISFDSFPLLKGEWIGERDSLAPAVVELLNPDQIFSATYTNKDEIKIQLFFDYFSSKNIKGAVHSPRNCLPGSGWVITSSSKRNIEFDSRVIAANRFYLRLKDSKEVMDYWYITRYGETASDYVLKAYTMVSAVTFRPTDVAFIRIVCKQDPESLESLEQFEKAFINEIYEFLPF